MSKGHDEHRGKAGHGEYQEPAPGRGADSVTRGPVHAIRAEDAIRTEAGKGVALDVAREQESGTSL